MVEYAASAANLQEAEMLGSAMHELNGTHDLSLPSWGPYSKKYAGISHIPDASSGLRVDMFVCPGFYRSRVLIPNVLFESAYYPWNANADLRQITYRYELEWKDRVFVDVTYSTIAAGSVLVAMRCVNHTALPQTLVLNLMAGLEYPDAYPMERAEVPSGAAWINAVDYRELTFAHPRPTDGLVHDGFMRGEVRSREYLDSSALAGGFGHDRGDRVSYRVPLPPRPSAGTIGVRYRLPKGTRVSFQLDG